MITIVEKDFSSEVNNLSDSYKVEFAKNIREVREYFKLEIEELFKDKSLTLAIATKQYYIDEFDRVLSEADKKVHNTTTGYCNAKAVMNLIEKEIISTYVQSIREIKDTIER